MIPKVKEWLEKQGFLLEMKTAAAFRQAGFEVRQCSHYVDPDSGKSREIDVLARDPDFLGIVDIQFAVECKASKKPWVLLCSRHTLSGYNRLFAFAPMSDDCRHVFAERLVDLLDKIPWLKKDLFAGYSFRQAHADPSSDPAYSAAMSAAKASDHLVRDSSAPYNPPYSIAFPVIVVDSPLLQCSLAEDGSIGLEEVAHGELLFFADLPRQLGSCIRIVTADYLSEFAIEAKQVANRIRDELKDEETKF
jgi:hypothetical protein